MAWPVGIHASVQKDKIPLHETGGASGEGRLGNRPSNWFHLVIEAAGPLLGVHSDGVADLGFQQSQHRDITRTKADMFLNRTCVSKGIGLPEDDSRPESLGVRGDGTGRPGGRMPGQPR